MVPTSKCQIGLFRPIDEIRVSNDSSNRGTDPNSGPFLLSFSPQPPLLPDVSPLNVLSRSDLAGLQRGFLIE